MVERKSDWVAGLIYAIGLVLIPLDLSGYKMFASLGIVMCCFSMYGAANLLLARPNVRVWANSATKEWSIIWTLSLLPALAGGWILATTPLGGRAIYASFALVTFVAGFFGWYLDKSREAN